MEHPLTLSVLPDQYAVVKLPANAPIPEWVGMNGPGDLFSVTRTPEELSIICPNSNVPNMPRAGNFEFEKGWACLKVDGPLDFSLTGILAGLTRALAAIGVTVFAISTYNTDYLMVRHESLERAVRALRLEGYTVVE